MKKATRHLSLIAEMFPCTLAHACRLIKEAGGVPSEWLLDIHSGAGGCRDVLVVLGRRAGSGIMVVLPISHGSAEKIRMDLDLSH